MLCGLPEGTVMAVDTGDDFSTPLGARLVTPGWVACVLGTAEVVAALDGKAKVDPKAAVAALSKLGLPSGVKRT